MSLERTLVIGDSHADPRFSNERFTALGNFIVEQKPDNIVQMGDFGNFDSISFHDSRKPLIKEGKRLSEDIQSMQDAYDKLMNPIREDWKHSRKLKKKKYDPRRFWLQGNHEDRVRRYLEQVPELVGFVPEKDFVHSSQDGWDLVEYKDYAFINGVAFTHIPMNPRSNQPVGGKYVTQRVVEGQQQSCVVGHTHTRQLTAIRRNDQNNGQRVEALSAGCFFDYDPHYIRGNDTQLDWWRGIIILTHTGEGEFDLETISMGRLKSEYL